MRKYGRIDANQPGIVKGLKQAGASVKITSAVGDGFTDLVVGFRRKNFLMEIKDPAQPPSKRALTEPEHEFHSLWRGQVAVVETLEQALEIISR